MTSQYFPPKKMTGHVNRKSHFKICDPKNPWNIYHRFLCKRPPPWKKFGARDLVDEKDVLFNVFFQAASTVHSQTKTAPCRVQKSMERWTTTISHWKHLKRTMKYWTCLPFTFLKMWSITETSSCSANNCSEQKHGLWCNYPSLPLKKTNVGKCTIMDPKGYTRWAPTSCKWSYNPHKWPFK